jgi:hypothetical protein
MKRFITSFLFLILFYNQIYAINIAGFDRLLNYAKQIQGINEDSLEQLNHLKSLQNEMNNMLSGHYNFGDLLNDPTLQQWGEHTETWQKVMQAYKAGKGAYNDTAATLEREFPIQAISHLDPKSFDVVQDKYYTATAESALASRAASQTAYEKAVQTDVLIEKLKKEIDGGKNQNLKSAVDLSIRANLEATEAMLSLVKLQAASLNAKGIEMQGAANAPVQLHQLFNLNGETP